MTDQFLPVPVPETLSARYLVPTSTPPGVTPAEALAGLGDRLSRPVRDLAGQQLDGPLMTAETRPISEFPPLPADLLAVSGATSEQLRRLAAATHLVVVEASHRSGWPPTHEWAARAVATAMAASVGGDLVDVVGPQFVDAATALRSLPDEAGRIRLIDWVRVRSSAADDGLWFTTKGLRRFGLLELQAHRVPVRLARPWGAVLTGVARRLLRTWTESLAEADPPAFVQLPIIASVTAHDIAAAHGDREQHPGGTARLRLELDPATDPDADSFLTVLPPPPYDGPPAEYFAQVCTGLFGSDSTEFRYEPASDAMARAIETARGRLTDIRDRFLSGRLPADTQLVVKYALPTDAGSELVWASVTSWSRPGRLFGASASDAHLDPSVRVGRPVVVDEADVVDWAVLDVRGVREGGWTQAVLDGREPPPSPSPSRRTSGDAY